MIDLTRPKRWIEAHASLPAWAQEARGIVQDFLNGWLTWRELPGFLWWLLTAADEERTME